jgi:5'-3' exonuclease
MLVDAASAYFRSFHGVPTSVVSPDGLPVNAVRGFLDTLARLVELRRPARLVACLDADWRPAFRTALVPSYKAHRVAADGGEAVPPELSAQVPVLLDVLAAVGVPLMGAPGFEADDVIGTLAARDPGPVDVVTGDRDLFQLVDDGRGVVVLYTGRGLRNLAVVNDAWLVDAYGVTAAQYADFATLRGDPSDGLPGVRGVGARTAADLVARWGDLDALLAALDDPGASVARRPALEAARAELAAARAVVAVRTDVPVDPGFDDRLPATALAPERLAELAARWGVERSVDRLLAVLAGGPA